MGQKVHPVGFRLGISRTWNSNWYANKHNFAKHLNNDVAVRKFIYKKLKAASVTKIQIDRLAQNIRIVIHSGRPGIIIGKKGGDIDQLRYQVSQILQAPVQITIQEVKRPELDAHLVAENIAQQLERRIMFRRAMKRAIQTGMKFGAQGIKVMVSGRLSGAEIARSESAREGRIPLHTLRGDIDYSLAEAHTTYGIIGVKVWIYKGEVDDKPASSRPTAHRTLSEAL